MEQVFIAPFPPSPGLQDEQSCCLGHSVCATHLSDETSSFLQRCFCPFLVRRSCGLLAACCSVDETMWLSVHSGGTFLFLAHSSCARFLGEVHLHQSHLTQGICHCALTALTVGQFWTKFFCDEGPSHDTLSVK